MISKKVLLAPWIVLALAEGASGQAALQSVTSARALDQRGTAPAAARPATQHARPVPSGETHSTADAARLSSKPHDREARRASAMFSKVMIAFNDKEHGKRIMTRNGPSYRLEDWYYFPVRIKSLTSRHMEDQAIMVNPVTGKFKLETAPPKAAED